jgi:hypothetical protein
MVLKERRMVCKMSQIEVMEEEKGGESKQDEDDNEYCGDNSNNNLDYNFIYYKLIYLLVYSYLQSIDMPWKDHNRPLPS